MNIATQKFETKPSTSTAPTSSVGIVRIVVDGLVRWSDRRLALQQFYQVPLQH